MLTLYPFQWVNRFALAPYISGFGSTIPSRRVLFYDGSTRRPYTFSFKPTYHRKNFCGNRPTSHLQVHGTTVMGPDVWYVEGEGFYWAHGGDRLGPFTDLACPDPGYTTTTLTQGRWSHGKPATGIFYIRRGASRWVIAYGEYTYDEYREWQPTGQRSNLCIAIRTYGLGNSWLSAPDGGWRNLILVVEGGLNAAIQRVKREATLLLNQYYSVPLTDRVSKIRFNPSFDITWGLKSSELQRLKAQLSDLAWREKPQIDEDYYVGEATQKAADACRYFDGNTAVFVSELIHLREAALSLKQLLSGAVTFKSVSSLLLNAKYGLRLTFLDAMDLAESIARKLNEQRSSLFTVSRGRVTEDGVKAGVKLYYDPYTRNAVAAVSATLFEWDLFPSFQNIWDLVPYSFCLDWVANIEGFLNAIDTRTYLSVLNVFSCCCTCKYEWSVRFPGSTMIHGDIVASFFHRWNQKEPTEPRPHFTGSLPSTNNIVTAAALIIQRL